MILEICEIISITLFSADRDSTTVLSTRLKTSVSVIPREIFVDVLTTVVSTSTKISRGIT